MRLAFRAGVGSYGPTGHEAPAPTLLHRRVSAMAAPGGIVSPVAPKLTRKEAALLALLQNNPRQCLSRNLLLRTIWGYQEGVKSRTVDVHVQRLRKKLGPETASRIMTVFRGGYLWNPNGDYF